MSGKVMIVGTGNVGASIAFAMLNQRTSVKELILTDINHADAAGEAMDLSDALTVAPSWLKIHASDYAAAHDADLCIITAGVNQKPGESRTDLATRNAAIVREITTSVMSSGFTGIFLVVTNPVDALTAVVLETSGLPPERVIGSGTILDSARLRFYIAKYLEIHPKSVHAYRIGEHGDSGFTPWSCANVGGENLASSFRPRRRQDFEERVRDAAYQIIEQKGATHYGIGACVVQIVNYILGDERRILPVSCYDDFNEIYYGYPAVVGRHGIVRRLDLKLTEEEGIALQKSINAIKSTLQEIK